MEKISNFEMSIKSKNLIYDARWHPYSIDTFEEFLTNGILKDANIGIVKNICYSMQYLQYISLQKEKLKLHSIVETMPIKNYIIIGISIIEDIFYSLIKINKLETLEIKNCYIKLVK